MRILLASDSMTLTSKGRPGASKHNKQHKFCLLKLQPKIYLVALTLNQKVKHSHISTIGVGRYAGQGVTV
jgi:hypothetical protein